MSLHTLQHCWGVYSWIWCGAQRSIFCHMLIISLFTNNCLTHCKTYVLLRGSSDVLLPKAATALTTKITVTGKAGITFYWADHTFALRLSWVSFLQFNLVNWVDYTSLTNIWLWVSLHQERSFHQIWSRSGLKNRATQLFARISLFHWRPDSQMSLKYQVHIFGAVRAGFMRKSVDFKVLVSEV